MRRENDASGWCPDHRKLLYSDRKRARKAARLISPGAHGNAFECATRPGWWHWGHLDSAVSRGAVSRRRRYAHGS